MKEKAAQSKDGNKKEKADQMKAFPFDRGTRKSGPTQSLCILQTSVTKGLFLKRRLCASLQLPQGMVYNGAVHKLADLRTGQEEERRKMRSGRQKSSTSSICTDQK